MPGSASAKRLTKAAKERQLFFDFTSGRSTKSLLLLDDGKLVGCAITPRTIALRIHSKGDDIDEGEKDDENPGPVIKALVSE